jgi:hypothetical protein
VPGRHDGFQRGSREPRGAREDEAHSVGGRGQPARRCCLRSFATMRVCLSRDR